MDQTRLDEFPRRRFLVGLAALASTLPVRAMSSGPNDPAARGRRFLLNLLDPDLDLLPEFRGSNTYWLYHDNYLAAHVLRPTDPQAADRIEAAIRGFGVTESGKIEIVTGEAKQPLPFKRYELKEVARRGDKVIKTELVTDHPLAGWEEYADLLFLAAMARAKEGEPEEASRLFAAGAKLWDGKGFADRVLPVHGLYATFKLALALLAAKAVETEFPAAAEVKHRLLALQNDEGGWITDYRPDLTPAGLPNVETTSLAMLALTES